MKNMKTKTWIFCLFILFPLIISCGDTVDDGENYGNILNSASGIVLTEEEHSYGWGRDDCLICHNVNNIHKVDQSGLGIDVEAIQEQTFEDGEDSCQGCHGSNGM